jgi:hypothetical protein
LVLITISWAVCPATGNINNFLAGTTALTSDSVSFRVNASQSVASQTYNYQFQSTFVNNPSVAIAMQSFALNQVGPNSFAIKTSAISMTNAQFLFEYTQSVWSSVKVNFWVSSNPEIQVGQIDASGSMLSSDMSCQNCFNVYPTLSSAFGASQNPVIRVFLNGFNLAAGSGALQISVAPTNLQNTNITIKVTMGKMTLVDRVVLSWIAFAPITASFVSYGGQVSKNSFSGAVS